ncbi:polyprenyl synthetase family protein [Bacillus andreraoultii]|uniref:polyprenyl synthetase family protein n=1 Tax=Bacillus andreraoultii TaxID=1499685 RepID=UPI00053AF18F|nr:farnesyl diphosphate synthase [Bacillus andreraoultii]
MEKYVKLINNDLEDAIRALNTPETLRKAMDYSLQAGGKRIRPLLIFATLKAFHKDIQLGLPIACAVEMIHTYSLIHDDLPAMDNDDLRRGKLTNHKVFGEAFAILAGDALLTYSFQLISEIKDLSADKKIKIINELARASGPEGMVAGQVADIEGENKSLSLKELEYIHTHKTGKLLSFCIKAGAILADADEKTEILLNQFGYHIGLAFQIRDDILDIEGTIDQMGKNIGSDLDKHKSTYPNILSLQGAKEKLLEHMKAAEKILENLPLDVKQLSFITDMVVNRNR